MIVDILPHMQRKSVRDLEAAAARKAGEGTRLTIRAALRLLLVSLRLTRR